MEEVIDEPMSGTVSELPTAHEEKATIETENNALDEITLTPIEKQSLDSIEQNADSIKNNKNSVSINENMKNEDKSVENNLTIKSESNNAILENAQTHQDVEYNDDSLLNQLEDKPTPLVATSTEHISSDDELTRVLTELEPPQSTKSSLPDDLETKTNANTTEEDSDIIYEVILTNEDGEHEELNKEFLLNISDTTKLVESKPDSLESAIAKVNNEEVQETVEVDAFALAKKQLELLNTTGNPIGRPRGSIKTSSSTANKNKTSPGTPTNGKHPPIISNSDVKDEYLEIVYTGETSFAATTSSSISPLQSLSNSTVKTMKNRLSKSLETKQQQQQPQKSEPTTPQSNDSHKIEPTGTIEIPKELISGTEEILMNTSANAALQSNKSLQNDEDLIAILEGKDDDDVIVPQAIKSESADIQSDQLIAIKQMMSLPSAPKGRRANKATTAETKTKTLKKSTNNKAASVSGHTSDLVNSLVSEWSESDDTDSKTDEPQTSAVNEEITKSPTTNNKKQKTKPNILNVETPPAAAPPFKRSRIIKKKIIWDPDAPETAISYASLVSSSSSSLASNKKASAAAAVAAASAAAQTSSSTTVATAATTTTSNVPKSKQEPKILNKNANSAGVSSTQQKRSVQTSSSSSSAAAAAATASSAATKKRKISEIDKLMADEGAANMLNALKHEVDLCEQVSVESDVTSVLTTKSGRTSKTPTSDDGSHTTTPRGRSKRPQTPLKNSAGTAAATIAATEQNIVVATKKETTKRKKPAAVKSESWDYIYSNRNDDSLIIRRRSNSSYSSTSPNRLSLDGPPGDATSGGPPTAKRSKASAKAKKFEFAKPNACKTASNATGNNKVDLYPLLVDIRSKPDVGVSGKTTATKTTTTTTNKTATATTSASVNDENVRRSTRGGAVSDSDDNGSFTVDINDIKSSTVVLAGSDSPINTNSGKQQKDKKSNHSTTNQHGLSPGLKSKTEGYNEIIVKRHRGCVHISLTPISGKIQNVFTIQLMNEVITALNSVKSDDTCKAVLITSMSDSFCNGLDYSTLIQSSAEKRKSCANELATTLSNFVHALATYKKPLIAGVTGRTIGIGVTILPLFDLVFATDNATFETPYARIGQIPEACCVLNMTRKINQNVKNELLFLCETLEANEAVRSNGLVTKVVSAVKFQSEMVRQTEFIASLSPQSLESTKSLICSEFLATLDKSLAIEQKLLVQHWTSVECQEKFKHFITTKKW